MQSKQNNNNYIIQRFQIDIMTANYILIVYAYPTLSTDSLYYLLKKKNKKSTAIPLFSEPPPLLTHDHCLAS